ncbi:helix-turn-helix domain-containing protein [Limosilactobacillus agrestis]|uniref:helix-turn-helix domain-containing protein n=1 Tax=Limosilactobacillus agrestis TaxID=2759748 RepID=UPI001E5CBC12|nr:helix-turn-helix domain-containing protein [Limosilactobacillus agrestis]MCD7113470.1 helix-turn-helix domain-containing protein [Limosilactobacillus agrestis]
MKNNDLAIRIVDLREKKNITQTELAKKMDLDKSSMSKIENGTRKVSSDEVAKLANIFNVTTDYLLGRTPTPQFTRRDERDVQKILEEMFNGLSDKNALSYMKNGDQEIDEEDAELLRASLENAIRMSKILAKKKFTPKKYRKNDN